MSILAKDPSNPFYNYSEELIETIYQRYMSGHKTTDLIREYKLEGVTTQNFTRMMPPKKLESPCPACGDSSLVQLRHNRTRAQSAKHPIKECSNCDFKVWPHQELHEQLDAPMFEDLEVPERFHLLVLVTSRDQLPYASEFQLTRVLEDLHRRKAIVPCPDQVSPYRLPLNDFQYRLNINNGSGQLMPLGEAEEIYGRYIKQNLFSAEYRDFYQRLVKATMQYTLLAMIETLINKSNYPFMPSPSLMMVLEWLLTQHSPHQCGFLITQAFEGTSLLDLDLPGWGNSALLGGSLIMNSDRFVKEGWGDPNPDSFPREILKTRAYILLNLNRTDVFRTLADKLANPGRVYLNV